MSRFATIQKGKRARKTIECPAPLGAPVDYVPVPVDLVVLSGDEEAEAIAGARAYAKRLGVEKPGENDPHYDLGLAVHTLVRALVDTAEPGFFVYFLADKPESKDFGAMVSVLLESFDREAITYLYQLQQVWQDECSPWGKGDTEGQILEKLMALRGVSDPAVPFRLWRPATVGSLLLTTVSRLAFLLSDRSPPGGDFGSSTGTRTSDPVADEERPASEAT